MWAAFMAQRRCGLLVGTRRQVERLQQFFPEKRVYNSIVLQPFYDSFDMLVIDLCSAAEAWLEPNQGLFSLLREGTDRLRPRSEDDFGGGRKGQVIARNVNAAINELVPEESPVTPNGIKRWRSRFLKATQQVRDDRNKVRAHRYEEIKGEREPSSYAVPLEAYVAHVEYLVRHIYLASMAINARGFDTEIKIPSSESADLADLIFHGSVGGAIWAYSRVCKAAAPQEAPPRYDELRERALQLLETDSDLYARAFSVIDRRGEH